MTVALCATAIVVLALLWEIIAPVARAPLDAPPRPQGGRAARGHAAAATTPAASAAPSSAPASSCARCVNEEEWAMYRDLGFIRVWGGQAAGPVATHPSRDLGGVPYAYLVYPHKPIVAYLPQTGQLLNEYCVEFPDETRPYGSARLPDSDDVLAKWMALKGDERRLIAEANLHLPGRQVDPRRSSATSGASASGSARGSRRAQRREDGQPRAAAPPARADACRRPAHGGRLRGRHGLARSPPQLPRSSLDGPARAAARAYLKGIGFDDEALAKPIIGVASHLDRDDAVQLPPARAGRQGQGGHPRRRRDADGVQHDRDLRRHHDGHERHAHEPRLAAR